MPVGVPNTRTHDSNITRDELIAMAYEDIKVKAEGEPLSAELLSTGIKKLNLIIREHDVTGKRAQHNPTHRQHVCLHPDQRSSRQRLAHRECELSGRISKRYSA
jgi:hypothetical protein